MRCRSLKGRRGSVVVATILLLPLLLFLLLALLDIGKISVSRARLQEATDRSALAGAAVLADALNAIAAANWKLHKAWRDLETDFATDSQQGSTAASERISRYEGARDLSLREMASIAAASAFRARAAVEDVLAVNRPGARAIVVGGDLGSLADDADRSAQYGRVSYGTVEGANVIDPESVAGGSFQGLKFLVRRPESIVPIDVVGLSAVTLPFLGAIVGEELPLEAVSTAQAFGGSVEDFARKETSSIDEAEAELDAQRRDFLYRIRIVP